MQKLVRQLVFVVLAIATLGPSALQAAPASPQVVFPQKKIKLGNKTLVVEIADNNERRSRGLMFRERLQEDRGMLFIFDDEQTLSFWMKNTLIPLAIGYFDRTKKLIDIQEMIPATAGELNPKTYPSRAPALYALELPKGWFARNKVEPGTRFTFIE